MPIRIFMVTALTKNGAVIDRLIEHDRFDTEALRKWHASIELQRSEGGPMPESKLSKYKLHFERHPDESPLEVALRQALVRRRQARKKANVKQAKD